jgi:hypothetical protein
MCFVFCAFCVHRVNVRVSVQALVVVFMSCVLDVCECASVAALSVCTLCE